MNRKNLRVSLFLGLFSCGLLALVLTAGDKYTVKVPGGLAFSEFRGYEAWQAISISRNEKAVAVILGNPVMIDAYRAGFPGNGKPVPDGAKMAKIHWAPKQNDFFPDATVPGRLLNVDLMVKDSKRFADSGGWGWAVFDYEPHPILSRPAPKLACPRRGTTPSAGSLATQERRREITFSLITAAGEARRGKVFVALFNRAHNPRVKVKNKDIQDGETGES